MGLVEFHHRIHRIEFTVNYDQLHSGAPPLVGVNMGISLGNLYMEHD